MKVPVPSDRDKSANPSFLFVIGGLGPGGSERQLVYLVRGLRRQGLPVCVAVWNFSEADVYLDAVRESGASLVGIPGSSRWLKTLSLRRLILNGRFSIVHSFNFYLNAIVAIAASGSGSQSVGSVRSTLSLATLESGRVLGRLSARWPRVQIFNNDAAAEEAAERRWWRPRAIEVLPNRVDIEAFPDTPAPGGGVIAGIGSLLPVKRWDRLIELASRLRDQRTDFEIRIAGDGPLRSALETDIRTRGLEDRIRLLGFTKDVGSLLRESSFLIHVSESEGSPNAVIEALAAGRAVVASDVGDVGRLVSDGETGFIIPSGDQDVLFRRVLELLTNPARCAAMGVLARQAARARFGADSIADDILNAYRKLVST